MSWVCIMSVCVSFLTTFILVFVSSFCFTLAILMHDVSCVWDLRSLQSIMNESLLSIGCCFDHNNNNNNVCIHIPVSRTLLSFVSMTLSLLSPELN